MPCNECPKYPLSSSRHSQPDLLHLRTLTRPRPLTLQRYILDDHILIDIAPLTIPCWQRMNNLAWIPGTIPVELQYIICEHGGTAH